MSSLEASWYQSSPSFHIYWAETISHGLAHMRTDVTEDHLAQTRLAIATPNPFIRVIFLQPWSVDMGMHFADVKDMP